MFSDVPPNQQSMGPGTFPMFRQPPPNMPPQGQFPPGPGQQNQFSFNTDPNSKQFNQGTTNLPGHPDSMEFNDNNEDLTTKSIEDEEDEDIAKQEEEARKQIDESSSNLKQQYEVSRLVGILIVSLEDCPQPILGPNNLDGAQ